MIPTTGDDGKFLGYYFNMLNTSTDAEEKGINNCIVCIVNMKVKRLSEDMKIGFEHLVLTNAHGQNSVGEDQLGDSIVLDPINTEKYDIIYNSNTQDNNVENIPQNEQKIKGKEYTISSEIPKRTGYTFKDWNTKADGTGSGFKCGEIYNVDESLELYAQWQKAESYDIKYNANVEDNTVKNMPKAEQKIEKVDYTISPTVPSREGYTFKGWNTKQDGTGTKYNPESIYNVDESLELYAIWEKVATSEKLYLSSKPYKIGNNDIDNYEVGDKYISRVVKETTKTNFIYNLDTNGKIRILKEDRTELKDGELVGTGMTLEVTKDEEKIELKIAVSGDVSGDGKVTVTDLSTMNQTVLGVVKLENEYKIAADLDENDNITVTDLSTENKMILGLVK